MVHVDVHMVTPPHATDSTKNDDACTPPRPPDLLRIMSHRQIMSPLDPFNIPIPAAHALHSMTVQAIPLTTFPMSVSSSVSFDVSGGGMSHTGSKLTGNRLLYTVTCFISIGVWLFG